MQLGVQEPKLFSQPLHPNEQDSPNNSEFSVGEGAAVIYADRIVEKRENGLISESLSKIQN